MSRLRWQQGFPESWWSLNFSAWVSNMAERQFCSQDCVYPCYRPWLVLSMGCGSKRHLIPESNTEDERCKHFTLSLSKLLSSTIKCLFFLLFLLYLQLSFSSVQIFPVIFTLFHYSLFPSYWYLLLMTIFYPLLPLSLPPCSPVSGYVVCFHQFP